MIEKQLTDDYLVFCLKLAMFTTAMIEKGCILFFFPLLYHQPVLVISNLSLTIRIQSNLPKNDVNNTEKNQLSGQLPIRYMRIQQEW